MGDQKPLILVIDHEVAAESGVVDCLTEMGFSTLVAGSGCEGRDLFRDHKPDVTLLELGLPDAHGMDLLREFRALSADAAVIVVSGNGGMGDAIESLRIGAWDYLTKPLHDLSALRNSVREAIDYAERNGQNLRYRKHLEEEVRLRTAELDQANRALEAKTVALQEILGSIEAERTRFGQQVHKNVERVILPQLRTLNHGLNRNQQRAVEQIEQGLEEIVSPFIDKVSRDVASLTTTELRVCTFIKRGLAVKEIAELEHLSPETIAAHRRSIRRKLGIANRKVNLTTYLRTVFTHSEAASR